MPAWDANNALASVLGGMLATVVILGLAVWLYSAWLQRSWRDRSWRDWPGWMKPTVTFGTSSRIWVVEMRP